MQVLGKNKVAVPTHLFKVILAEKNGDRPNLGVFIIPNKPIKDVDLKHFQVSLDQLELYCGYIFHPDLNRDEVSLLKKIIIIINYYNAGGGPMCRWM